MSAPLPPQLRKMTIGSNILHYYLLAIPAFSIPAPTNRHTRGYSAHLSNRVLNHAISARGGGSDVEGFGGRGKLVQVQLVHRHGDRTPITPLNPEAYWASLLPSDAVLTKIATGTAVVRGTSDGKIHGAAGFGPYGKLTQLGLRQMIELGSSLRAELEETQPDVLRTVDGDVKKNLRVVTTDMARTILSARGFLAGMFPDGTGGEEVEMDARHTSYLIPDPQPRRSEEQAALEAAIVRLWEAEGNGGDLRARVSNALYDHSIVDIATMLAEGISFGVGEDLSDGGGGDDPRPVLQWGQLSEILKCLQVRDRLPPSLAMADADAVKAHTGGRWFRLLRHERLSELAMGPMVRWMVANACAAARVAGGPCLDDGGCGPFETSPAPLQQVSAHDSTLIGLLCAFRLETPSEWPPYASAWRMDLHRRVVRAGDVPCEDYVVRFSLNGKTLRCSIGADGEDVRGREHIPLDDLKDWANSLRKET
mmetsp:Transcript_35453/g.69807  ORF Transcript_35453/g.69807 Transcript_35453/m.69807 type:complete len:479 (+) Transcript_35453:99-1535(+)